MGFCCCCCCWFFFWFFFLGPPKFDPGYLTTVEIKGNQSDGHVKHNCYHPHPNVAEVCSQGGPIGPVARPIGLQLKSLLVIKKKKFHYYRPDGGGVGVGWGSGTPIQVLTGGYSSSSPGVPMF